MASGTIKAVASKSDTDAILGTGKTWINNAELNDYKTTGLYYIGSGAKVGGTATSLFNYSVLMVYAGQTDRTVQTVYIDGGTDIVSRQWNANTWTAWKHYSDVKVNLTDNLSSFTGASLVQYVKDSGKSIHITSTSGANRVSDLPVYQAGTYIVMPGSYYADIVFIGTNGSVYFHKYDNNEWVNGTAKYYDGAINTSSISPSTNGSVTVPIPSDGTAVKSIIPYGYVPADHWNSQIVFTSVNNSTRTINFRVLGSGNAQVFSIKYTVIYI